MLTPATCVRTIARTTVHAMPFASVNGQQIHYEDSGGTGPAVILAHGFMMDHTMFDPQLPALVPEFRVIRLDERTFGQTIYDGQPFDYWDSARDCLALLTHLGIERAVVGGMSQGGFLSLRAALLAPERMIALTLMDTAADVDPPEVLEGYKQMGDGFVSMGPVQPLCEAVASIIITDEAASAPWIAKWQARTYGPEWTHCSDALLQRDDISARLGEITCPVLVVHGEIDASFPMSKAEAIAAGVADSRGVVRVPRAGHAANMTHPEVVNGPLVDFLRSVTVYAS